MTVNEIYKSLNMTVPTELSCEWDNDGLMCSDNTSREVKRVLVTLDVTDRAIDRAVSGDFDLIVSHHPLVFRPLPSVTEDRHIAKKVIRLIKAGISVISLHTRLDRVDGGVNDKLSEVLGLCEVRAFGEDGLGRIGKLTAPMSANEFAAYVKGALGADAVRLAGPMRTVRTVALVGGDGKDYVRSAISEGADTYLSGRIGYNVMEEAPEMGINLIEAGHYFTEAPVCEVLEALLCDLDGALTVEIFDSNEIKTV